MSGHSKWSTIKRQKATSDARRSNLFTKLANAVSLAARAGGDPGMNFQLRLALERARSNNMPKDNIERAIKRGTGEGGAQRVEEITYEIYGPAGTAILVEAVTDNKNRTSAEVKATLNKFGGKLAGSGAVSYLFERKGLIKIIAAENEETELKIIDSGADDYEPVEGGYLVYVAADKLKLVKDALEAAGFKVESSELVFEPKSLVAVAEEQAEKVVKLLEALDELDEVVTVSSNVG